MATARSTAWASSTARGRSRGGAVGAASVGLRARGCVKRVVGALTPRCAPLARRGAVTAAVKDEDDASEVVLGVYVNASAEDLRAAPVDARTGEFAKAGASTKLEARTARGIAEAVAKLVGTLEWRGRVGVSLPGLLTRVEGEVETRGRERWRETKSRRRVERRLDAMFPSPAAPRRAVRRSSSLALEFRCLRMLGKDW